RKASSSLAVGASVAIHAVHQALERSTHHRQGTQTRLEGRHHHRRRNTFSRHVGHHKQNSVCARHPARPQDHIVVISRHRIRGTRRIRNLVSRNLQRCSRQHPCLNVLGDLQIALHHHPVCQFEQQ